jgi:dihydroorotase
MLNPPLREEAYRLALIGGLREGSIDVIATDHAPHHADEKALEFDRAPFGITGLETAVSLCLDRLVHAGVIGLPRLIELLSTNPARILGIPGGTLVEGGPADLTILAPDASVTIDVGAMKSKSRNMPFDGWTLRGAAAATMVGGRLVYVNKGLINADC